MPAGSNDPDGVLSYQRPDEEAVVDQGGTSTILNIHYEKEELEAIKAGRYHTYFTWWGNFSGSKQVRLGWNSALSTLSYYLQMRTYPELTTQPQNLAPSCGHFYVLPHPFCLVNPVTSLSAHCSWEYCYFSFSCLSPLDLCPQPEVNHL